MRRINKYVETKNSICHSIRIYGAVPISKTFFSVWIILRVWVKFSLSPFFCVENRISFEVFFINLSSISYCNSKCQFLCLTQLTGLSYYHSQWNRIDLLKIRLEFMVLFGTTLITFQINENEANKKKTKKRNCNHDERS